MVRIPGRDDAVRIPGRDDASKGKEPAWDGSRWGFDASARVGRCIEHAAALDAEQPPRSRRRLPTISHAPTVAATVARYPETLEGISQPVGTPRIGP